MRAAKEDKLVGVGEAALRVNVHTHSIRRAAAKGLLPFQRRGGRLLFRPKDLDEYAVWHATASPTLTKLRRLNHDLAQLRRQTLPRGRSAQKRTEARP